MKRKFNKDGSIDLIYSDKEFEMFIVGCVINRKNGKWTVRVKGIVPDLSNVVLRKKLIE